MVTCFIIAPIGEKINQKCLDSVMNQDYKDFDVLVHYQKPIDYKNFFRNLYTNCSSNRSIARKMALAGDSKYFLILDSDIILPKNAITNFMLQSGKRVTTIPCLNPDTKEVIPAGTSVPEIQIQGGWYPIYAQDSGELCHYVAGKWIADNTFYHFPRIENSLISTDSIGMGCCFLTRKALEDISFSDGLNISLKNNLGHELVGGECLDFGNKANDKGYLMFMNGSVVCGHYKKGIHLRRIKWKLKSTINKLRTLLTTSVNRLCTRILYLTMSEAGK